MTFTVREDTEPPILSRHVPLRGACANAWPAEVRALCKDDMNYQEVTVGYAINHVPQGTFSLNRESRCYWYSRSMEGSVSIDDTCQSGWIVSFAFE